jgi:signal transduction histidine kinase
LVAGAGLVLLPLLAWLQFRWIGQVSAAETERMRRNLGMAASQMARECDEEITRVHNVIQLGRPPREGEELEVFSARYQEWTHATSHRQILKGMWVERGGAGWWRLDLATGQFQKAEPAAYLPAGPSGAEPMRLPQTPFQGTADPDVILLVTPYFFRPEGAMMRPEGPPPFLRVRPAGVTVLELDARHLRTTLIPQLVARHLPQEYRVQVRNREGGVVYDTAGGGAMERADIQIPLLTIRPMAAPGMGRGMFPPREMPNPPPATGEAVSFWQLLAQHEAGSLGNYVAAAQRKNLWLSFGILLLLGGAMAVLVVGLRRERELAELQLEFVAGVSHELRTPLSVIRSAGENLADGVASGPEQVRRYGALVRDEGTRLTEMVEPLLAFAKTVGGGKEIERKPVRVGELVTKAIGACAAENSAAVARELPDGLPDVLGDEVALTAALRNLVSNALRHGPPVTVKVRQAGDQVEFSVEDHGAGIAVEDLPHLFEPFYRGAGARGRGLGLGLALVRRIAEAHGGSVSAKNRDPQGAEFTLRLPGKA